MKSTTRLLFALLIALSLKTATATGSGAPRTFVLVHGASGGGWDWKNVDHLLTADGNTVYRVTLTGLGEKVHLASPEISLSTHVSDVVNVILFEDLRDVVLAGHSYGGMVITGVMDRIPERISHVVFLDVAAPDDGMSAQDVWGKLSSAHKVIDGQIHFGWLKPDAPYPRDVPQSLKTYTEPVSYKNPAAKNLPVTYLVFTPGDQTMEAREKEDRNLQRARARGWTLRQLVSDHNAQRSHPKELVKLLEEASNDRNHSPR